MNIKINTFLNCAKTLSSFVFHPFPRIYHPRWRKLAELMTYLTSERTCTRFACLRYYHTTVLVRVVLSIWNCYKSKV